MAEEEPVGFREPVTQALLERHLWAGVPRSFGILNLVGTGFVTLGLLWFWALAIGLALHMIVRLLTTYDPDWGDVVVRYCRIVLRGLWHTRFYES